MKISEAIDLMAKNPAVDFPWEGIVITLVNSFLSEDDQLDPRTAEATEITSALDRLDASTKQMVLNTSIGSDAMASDEDVSSPSNYKNKLTSRYSMVFIGFGVVMCICALLMAMNVGNGVEGGTLVDILKIVGEVMTAILTSSVN